MKIASNPRVGRQILIRGMAYAPTTELGVVCLFGRLAPQLGMCIELVRPQFCDCFATRRGLADFRDMRRLEDHGTVHPLQ